MDTVTRQEVELPKRPLLKYAVTLEECGQELRVRYRGQMVSVDSDNVVALARTLRECDGRRELGSVLARSPSGLEGLLALLANHQMLLDGAAVLLDSGKCSGRELFWRLEALLLRWKAERSHSFGTHLFRNIAEGTAPPSVVEGFFLEQGHLLRAVPEELSAAVLHAPSEEIRNHYMDFYDEESRHGQMTHAALSDWFATSEELVDSPPLPATGGLMRTYRVWAEKSPLKYAVALMRDEGSALDPVPEFDPYVGARTHYGVPEKVVSMFEWHANLDRTNDHGFFAERIFACYPEIDALTRARLASTLREIVDLHELVHWNIVSYYGSQGVQSRVRAAESLL